MTWNTITNGTLPDADDVMENFTTLKGRIRKYRFSSSTEESTNSTSYVTLKTGTLTPPSSENVCLFYKISWEGYSAGGGTYYVKLQVGGSDVIEYSQSVSSYTADSRKGLISNYYTNATYTGGRYVMESASNCLLSSSYTINVQAKSSSGSYTTYLRNVVVDVYVLDFNGEVDTTSPSFS